MPSWSKALSNAVSPPTPPKSNVAKLAAEVKAAEGPSGWGSVGSPGGLPRPPMAGTAHDPEPHARVWDGLADDAVALPGITFREAVGHHYADRPGGLNRALVRSQEAMEKHGVPFPVDDEFYQYGRWQLGDVDTPIGVWSSPELGKRGAAGVYLPNRDRIEINPAIAAGDSPTGARNGVLEHEVTHGLIMSPLFRAKQEWLRSPLRQWSAPYHHLPFNSPSFGDGIPDMLTAGGGSSAEYLMRRSELDPRVAEIRRRFASVGGRDVNTPADAQDAWEWWRENGQRFGFGGDMPMATLTPSAFSMYDSLPQSSKDIIFRRMTQVPAVTAPIATGGLLGGLTARNEESR